MALLNCYHPCIFMLSRKFLICQKCPAFFINIKLQACGDGFVITTSHLYFYVKQKVFDLSKMSRFFINIKLQACGDGFVITASHLYFHVKQKILVLSKMFRFYRTEELRGFCARQMCWNIFLQQNYCA